MLSRPQEPTRVFAPIVPNDREHLNALVHKHIKDYGNGVSLNHIDVSRITDMSGLFYRSPFNGNISRWNVSNATTMEMMFEESSFNGDISHWNVANVKNMNCMFAYSPFNQDISRWNVTKVESMRDMFRSASFMGDLSLWQPERLVRENDMFAGSSFFEQVIQNEPSVFHWLHALRQPEYLTNSLHRKHLLDANELALALTIQGPLSVARLAQQTWLLKERGAHLDVLSLPTLE